MSVPSFVSPGVYTRELDFSLYVPALATTQFGVVITAPKGPVDVMTLCTSEDQFINNFGVPTPSHVGMYACVQYLRQGNQLKVVRVAGYNEATGQLILKASNGTTPAVIMTPTSSGSWVNDGGTTGLQLVVRAGNKSSTWDILVQWRGVTVETYSGVTLTSGSNNIVTKMSTSSYCTAALVGTPTTLSTGTFVFLHGVDGYQVTDADVIGTTIGDTRTGLQIFRDPEHVDVNLLAVPGNFHANVIAELISICESRQDCMCLIDPPTGMSLQQVVDWHNGLGGYGYAPAAALNSSYAALYWSWPWAFSGWDNANLYQPPSGFAAAQMALTDRDFSVWFAPAGFRRGRLTSALNVEYSPTQGERDYMLGGSAGNVGINRVNPIVNFPGGGITIYGQSTLQRSPTALDSINVRRMLLYLRKVIATASQFLVFEQNDDRLWADFKGLVNPFLDLIKAGRGITNYQVVMDKNTNTAAVRANKTCVGYILIEPTLPAEKIVLNFTLLPQGANFSEFVTTL
jgi:phage tail sheath protein FI